MGRQLVVADRMDLHLLWDKNGRVFLKPIPAFIFNQDFWRDHLKCPAACACRDTPQASCKTELRSIAFGFLYTYVCLISSEADFFVASEARLLPRKTDGSAILWAEWKQWARELLSQKNDGSIKIHPRFLHAELRLSRVNTIHRLTHFPLLTPYLRGRNTYGSLFSDNIAWLATVAVFIALVLTAMQVGLATDQLKGDAAFQQASYGFAIFAILAPICMFGLVGNDSTGNSGRGRLRKLRLLVFKGRNGHCVKQKKKNNHGAATTLSSTTSRPGPHGTDDFSATVFKADRSHDNDGADAPSIKNLLGSTRARPPPAASDNPRQADGLYKGLATKTSFVHKSGEADESAPAAPIIKRQTDRGSGFPDRLAEKHGA
ncbi:hypothetical protein MAPG_10753 [Magnaporthiopsis poae ATCC 64411]|uniref:Uncharacterized protein n=1 Tax=Magnaporthiopsis poae (strain ATCC 64411 / 73-15) TaxID=644358 RepID=A0A0C4EDF5_MAGP6|nr:hypothetical protein MAPG_10753 [Magnaporthiopsis poae ATCC 64411]